MRDGAELLGNTPAVARRSYIDPRVLDLCQSGSMVAPAPGSALKLDGMDETALLARPGARDPAVGFKATHTKRAVPGSVLKTIRSANQEVRE